MNRQAICSSQHSNKIEDVPIFLMLNFVLFWVFGLFSCELGSARKLMFWECLVRERQIRGLRSTQNKEFTLVSDWFLYERNEEIGVFWQA